jgi:nucleotide-binding universal stress UspA family protein
MPAPGRRPGQVCGMTEQASYSLEPPVICGISDVERAPAAAGVAGLLARRLSRRLELLHVFEPGARPYVDLVRSAQAALSDVLDPGRVTVRLESGDPHERLAAAGEGAELLVVGAPAGAIRHALGHGVATPLIQEPTVPVVVVPANDLGARPGRGVVCGVRDRRDLPCAKAAARLARDLGEPLELVHVVQPPISTAMAIEGIPPAVADEEQTRVEAMLEQIAAEVEAELEQPAATRTETGQPGYELGRVARERAARMVAVGSPDRGPLAAALTGAASRQLVRHAQVPVMVCPTAAGRRGDEQGPVRSS